MYLKPYSSHSNPCHPPLAPSLHIGTTEIWRSSFVRIRGWSGGAMVLGKLPVPGRPTILSTVGQGPIALAVGAGGGGLEIFTLIYPFFSFSLSLGDGPIWTEILSQRAVKPKTTNQPKKIVRITIEIFCPIIELVPFIITLLCGTSL